MILNLLMKSDKIHKSKLKIVKKLIPSKINQHEKRMFKKKNNNNNY